jgi:hypothetical protein
MLGHILQATHDSLQLGLLALYEGRYADACDLAEEAWGLKRCREATAIGLMGSTALSDPIEIARWLRRRGRLRAGTS